MMWYHSGKWRGTCEVTVIISEIDKHVLIGIYTREWRTLYQRKQLCHRKI